MKTSSGPIKRIVSLFIWILFASSNNNTQGQESSVDRALTLPEPIGMSNVPDWLADHQFKQPEFHFARVKYPTSNTRTKGMWATDYPAADLALAAQVASLTQLTVPDPGSVTELTNPELRKLDFLYMAEAGSLSLTVVDSEALRKYLDAGGFLMLDDSWGDYALQNIQAQLKKVFPDKQLNELTLEHSIFHNVFDLKELPQAVSIHNYMNGFQPASPARYFAIMQDDPNLDQNDKLQGRISVLVCHNTDLADGWERARDSDEYRRDVSDKLAFPMAINAIFHALSSQR